ncbi:MAG: prephenate dehydrogenase [Planctomycetes bacterium]|nr:prephenate dehydrogenase [Planctomycetota bacterium]
MPTPTIAVIGRGRFGAYWANQLSLAARTPLTWDIADDDPARLNAAASCDIVFFTVPIRAQPDAARAVTPLMRPGSIAVDACTVKTLPLMWMRDAAPPHVHVVGVHHLFGPQSAPDTCRGQRAVVCDPRTPAADAVARLHESMGIDVIRTTAEDHDHQVAYSQLLTHFIGRAIDAFNRSKSLDLTPLRMATVTYRDLMHIKDVVCGNTWDLFEDMNTFNPSAHQARQDIMNQLANIHTLLNTAATRNSTHPTPPDHSTT